MPVQNIKVMIWIITISDLELRIEKCLAVITRDD